MKISLHQPPLMDTAEATKREFADFFWFDSLNMILQASLPLSRKVTRLSTGGCFDKQVWKPSRRERFLEAAAAIWPRFQVWYEWLN